MTSHYRRSIRVVAIALSMTFAAAAQAQQHGKIEVANPNIHGDGTRSLAAHRAMTRGPLPRSDEEVALKAAANRAAAEATKSRQPGTHSPESGEAPFARAPALAPAIVGNHKIFGQMATDSSPSDSTGTIGPFSYIQTVNTSVRIYNRATNAGMGTATLSQFAGVAASVDTFDPQIMWDPTTNRFYYVMDAVFSANDNRLAFGFSKTNNPTSFSTADWCKYTYAPTDPKRFPDYPKLGDTNSLLIIGVNSFRGETTFLGSDLIAISKPPAGTACPAITSLKMGTRLDLRDTSNQRVFTPVPANQVDDSPFGYVIARDGGVPSTSFWFYSVTVNGSGVPVFGAPRGLTVPSYTIPPAAQQATFTQVIDTLDARHTQAVQATNPTRGTFSFWVQHTIKAIDARSVVRWYEINPVPATPVLLRWGQIGSAGSFFYNASISPDRRKDGATTQFGGSFVIQYNVSSSTFNIPPRIDAGSSVNGGAMTFATVVNGVSGYRDFTCPNPGDTCRWGDYSSAMPDPRPTTVGRGEVWITNQFSGLANPPPNGANFRTWIEALQP